MPNTIAICNQKGGVGKTTTTVNLGAALAEQGWRVLMVDLDPQAALTAYWGLEGQTPGPTVYRLLLDDSATPAEALCAVRPLIDIIPSDIDLAAAEIELWSALGRERILQEALAPLQGGYDANPPSERTTLRPTIRASYPNCPASRTLKRGEQKGCTSGSSVYLSGGRLA